MFFVLSVRGKYYPFMKTAPPLHTADIFERLSKGQFISEDSHDEAVKLLYDVIDDETTYETLHEYFLHIGFTLEKGRGYYYFSRKQKAQDIDRKIEQAYRWIDILDFLKTYGKSVDRPFTQGTVFSPNQIFEECKVNNALGEKLENLRRYGKFKANKPYERVQKVADALVQESVAELINEFTNEYKVLAAFHYLEGLVMSININADEHEEIPE